MGSLQTRIFLWDFYCGICYKKLPMSPSQRKRRPKLVALLAPLVVLLVQALRWEEMSALRVFFFSWFAFRAGDRPFLPRSIFPVRISFVGFCNLPLLCPALLFVFCSLLLPRPASVLCFSSLFQHRGAKKFVERDSPLAG